MNKNDLNSLKNQIQQLKKHTPANAVRFLNQVVKVEKQIDASLNQSPFKKIFFRNEDPVQDLNKKINELEFVQSKLRSINTISENTERDIDNFLEKLELLVLANFKHKSKVRNSHQKYCQDRKLELSSLLNNVSGTVELQGAESKLNRINSELARRKNSVHLLDKIQNFYTEYEGAEEIITLYDSFSDIEEDDYTNESLDSKFQEIDINIDELKKVYEIKYPTISASTEDSLRDIGDWLRALPDSSENKSLRRLKEELTTEYSTFSDQRFSDNNSTMLDELDRRTSVLMETVLELVEKYKIDKLNTKEPLYNELIEYFPDLGSLQISFSHLSEIQGSAEELRKWTESFNKLSENFDNRIANHLAEILRIKEKHLEESKKRIQEIENGPCSKEVYDSVLMLKEKLIQLERVNRATSQEEIVNALVDIKQISHKISQLKSRADEDRKEFQQAIGDLKEQAIILDKQIDKSGLNFNTSHTVISDKIQKIDVSSDITFAVEKLQEIEGELRVIEADFNKKCESHIQAHQEHISTVHNIFKELLISFAEPEAKDLDIIESLQYFQKYCNEIDDKLGTKSLEFNSKRIKVIESLHKAGMSETISNYDKDILNQLESSLTAWEANNDDLGNSLIFLQTLIVDAEHKITLYAQEEIRGKSHTKLLKDRINKFNMDYDSKYFPEVRKTLNKLIYGAEYATNHWKEVNLQLDSAERILANIEKEARRIMIHEFKKHTRELDRYLKINATNDNKGKDYEDALKVKKEIESYKDSFPPRLSRLRLDSLLIRLV